MRNFEACSQARGILTAMEKFHFLFGVIISEKIFSITDSLSKAFQKKDLSAIAARKDSLVVVSTLKQLRNDSEFSKFWTNVKERAIQWDKCKRESNTIGSRRAYINYPVGANYQNDWTNPTLLHFMMPPQKICTKGTTSNSLTL